MGSHPRARSPQRGYTLIELLVVLAILAIVTMFVVPNLGPKSPKAVRSGLQDLKASLQQARGIALANGKNINVHIVLSGNIARMTAVDLNDDGTEKAPALMDVAIGQDWRRYADFTTSDPPIPNEGTTAVKDLTALTTLGFSGWATPIEPDAQAKSYLGFSPQGAPQFVDKSTKARSAVSGGTWVGVKGLTIKDKGLPYGCVFLLENGLITAYYKPDALLTDAANQWQRLE
jgi:type II secretion system protein H